MVETYRELGKQAENAVRGIKDKDLRREAFKIILLQMIAAKKHGLDRHRRRGLGSNKIARVRGADVGTAKPAKLKNASRPGRRGGGAATLAIQKLIDLGLFKKGRDAAGVMNKLEEKRIFLQPSQLRMTLLRFSRAGKLRRRVKMKGDKVTYLYSAK